MPADPVLVKKPQPPRVLIADDASGMRTYLRLVLESGGYACTEVVDGGEAFDEVLKNAFDVVITDLEMPGMDGFQLLSAIGLLPAARRPAVIVVSALLDETLADRRPELRAAAALLAKLVQPADLLKSIGKVIGKRACG